MSTVKLLEKMIMLCLRFVLKTTIIALPVSGMLMVVFIILSDEFFRQIIFPAFFLTALFSFTCCLLTLSRICVLPTTSEAEESTIGELGDPDLIYDNETEEVPFYKPSYHCRDIGNTLKNLIWRNPLEFSKFRPAYGMFLAFGFAFLFAFAAALLHTKKWNNKDDTYCSAAELACPMIIMISLTYLISNTGIYTAEKDHDLYVPFEEFVQVPMKIFVGKTVAVFLTAAITRCLLMLFMFSAIALSIISTDYVYPRSEIDEKLKDFWPLVYPDPRRFVSAVLVAIMISSVSGLFGMILSSFFQAKNSILGVIEKNFQRNLAAISFLLPNTEAETLQDLKNALEHKRKQPLKAKEVAAFNYIYWPIWRTKQPFMLQMFGRDAAEPESDKQPDASEQDEQGHVQQSDDASEPEHEKMKHVTQLSQPVVHEMVEPSTSASED